MLSNLKEQVLRKVDIVEFIGRYVKLKRNGTDSFGCCPFHSERTPSFSVSRVKGMYKCFGCGVTGDVIDFVMRHVHRSMTFSQALEFLAKDANIVVQSFKEEKRRKAGDGVLEHFKVVDKSVMERTLGYYERNTFVRWMADRLGSWDASVELAMRNYIGTCKDGSVLWWQLDRLCNVRTAQRIRYQDNGHRDKSVVAKKIYRQEDGYYPCLYNEHLLTSNPDAVVGIVESEKTAFLCGLYLPELDGKPVIWLASCGMNGMTESKVSVLKRRSVVLVPDWSYVSRATWGAEVMRKKKIWDEGLKKEVVKVCEDGDIVEDYVSVSGRLKRICKDVRIWDPMPEIRSGADIADFLIRMPMPMPKRMPEDKDKDVDVGEDVVAQPFGW